MTLVLPTDRMPEAEVALRLAFWLLGRRDAHPEAQVAIDGAQIKVHGNEVFPIEEFLHERRWKQVRQEGKNSWQGTFNRGEQRLILHARSGVGDVVARVNGIRVRAEVKKGPLIKKKSSPEYPLLREAIGQVMTVARVEPNDLMVVAVPMTAKFQKLAGTWRQAPLMQKVGIQIALISRDGNVDGLSFLERT